MLLAAASLMTLVVKRAAMGGHLCCLLKEPRSCVPGAGCTLSVANSNSRGPAAAGVGACGCALHRVVLLGEDSTQEHVVPCHELVLAAAALVAEAAARLVPPTAAAGQWAAASGGFWRKVLALPVVLNCSNLPALAGADNTTGPERNNSSCQDASPC